METQKRVVLRSMSQPRLSGLQTCALEKLTVQPVGTSDHYLDRCYCYLCTCGRHCCPGDLKKSAAPPYIRGMKSYYKREFTGQAASPAHPFHLPPQCSLQGHGKMELLTTQQHDFKRPAFTPVMPRSESCLKPTVKCVTRSSYQRDFPDWKPGETVLFKCKELPYRGNFVGFTARSTYQDEFESRRTVEPFRTDRGKKRSDPIAVLSDFYGETTHRAEYQQPQQTNRHCEARRQATSDALESPPLRTTYQQEFHAKDQPLRLPFKLAAKRLASALGEASDR